jgi:hypothetical protein
MHCKAGGGGNETVRLYAHLFILQLFSEGAFVCTPSPHLRVIFGFVQLFFLARCPIFCGVTELERLPRNLTGKSETHKREMG